MLILYVVQHYTKNSLIRERSIFVSCMPCKKHIPTTQSLTFEKCLQKLNHISFVYENGMLCLCTCGYTGETLKLYIYQLLCMIWIAKMHNVCVYMYKKRVTHKLFIGFFRENTDDESKP